LILKPSATSRTVLERFDHRERVVAVVAAIAIRLTTFGTDQELAEAWAADPNGVVAERLHKLIANPT
jgi:hypothetical protein